MREREREGERERERERERGARARMLICCCGGVCGGVCVWCVCCWGLQNPQFESGYLMGVLDGSWFAMVTVTTVGYGDKARKYIHTSPPHASPAP